MDTNPDHQRSSASASWTDAAGSGDPSADQQATDPTAPGCLVGPTTDESAAAGVDDAKPIPPRIAIYFLALVGGLGGILAAIVQELRNPALLAAVLIVPAIEEICKPLGVILMIEKRPRWIRTGGEVIVMSMLGALTFATVENVLYIFVYAPNHGADFIAWRLIVCTSMHVVASGIVGIGLARAFRVRKPGKHFTMDRCIWFYVAAVAIHGVYNATVIVLELTGVLTFD